MLISLGGPLFANDKIIEGGDANIELNFPGYFEQSSGADPAYRNVFTSQDQIGMYWLNDYSEYSGYAAFFDVGANYEQPGHDLIPTFFYSLSVRYVRNVETNK
jgi:hypothetical protein